MYELLLVILGLGGLWLGAELVVKGSQNIARFFKISTIVSNQEPIIYFS